jgi:two-component system nitrogen regulation response regulator GlnG
VKSLDRKLLTDLEALGLSGAVAYYLRSYFKDHQDHLPPGGLYHRVMEEVETVLFQETLKAVDGNQVKASDILGIHRNTLRRKLRERAPL